MARGPRINPYSARSDRNGVTLRKLPRSGCKERAPRWPIPVEKDDTGTETAESKRARQIWREAWKYPQAVAWHEEEWRWEAVAEYARLKASIESDPSRSAALVAQLHKYRDQLGLTPNGLKDNLWEIVPDDRTVEPVRNLGGSRARYAAAVKAREEEAG